MSLPDLLRTQNQLIVRQRRELLEVFGFETRNKYEICNERGEVLGYCAEQRNGILGALVRNFLGHWRTFEIHFFDNQRQLIFVAKHPFRLFFQRLEVYSPQSQLLGSLQQRFALFRKKFDVEDSRGQVQMTMSSGFFQFWTFPFYKNNNEVAVVRKKWSGLFQEAFLDADNFQIEFKSGVLSEWDRSLILAASLFIDLQYFEEKGSGGGLQLFED